MPSKVTDALNHGTTFLRSALFDRRLPVAYVGGWLGKKNLGDDALLAAYKALFPTLNLVHFDGGRITSQIVRRLPRMNAGMLGGGTLIGQKPVWLEIPRDFLKLRPNLLVFGTGVEEPSFWQGEPNLNEWKPLLERCRFVGVRGPRSAELLDGVGLKGVEIVGDPVLTFALKDINPDPIPNSIGLNIGTSDGKVWGNETRIREEVVSFAKQARQAGWRVEWFVVWPKDLEMTVEAARASGCTDHIHVICEDHELFIRETRRLTAFIGMKLHATVLATCALTPSIMLEYRPKCRDYMESIGQGHFTFRTSEFRAGELWEIVENWNRHRSDAANALAQAIHARQSTQREAAAKATVLLESF